MERIEIKTSRLKMLGLFVLGVLIVCCSGFIMVRDMGLPAKIIGGIGVLFFGFCTSIILRFLFDPRPRIVLDAEGVEDRTLGVGKIAWNDIAAVLPMSVSGNQFIALRLVNAENYLRKLSPVKRWLARGNRTVGFESLNLNLRALELSPDEITRHVIRFLTRYKTNWQLEEMTSIYE